MPTNLAKAGNKVTLNFVTSFPIIGDPTVNFKSGGQDVQNNNNITYNNPTDRRTWEASYDVDSDDDDGVVTFTISGTDYKGKLRTFTIPTENAPSSGVTIDTTSPSNFSISSVSSTGGTDAVITSGYYNATNTGIDITIPIANDDSLDTGTVEVLTKTGNANFSSLQTEIINSNNINSDLTISIANSELTNAVGWVDGNTMVFQAIINDHAGNPTTSTSNTPPLQLIIDTTRPTVSSFTTTTSSGYYKAGEEIVITANTSENIQINNSITVILDTGDTVTLTATSAGKKMTGDYIVGEEDNSTGLTINSFTIVEVKDTAGNAMTSDDMSNISIFAGKIIVIDTTKPDPPVISTNAPYQTITTPEITGTAEANSLVEIYNNGTKLGDQQLTNDNTDWSITLTALAETQHTIFAQATDAAGNVSAASDSYTFIVDTIAPTITSVAVASNNDTTTLAKEGNTITFIVGFSEAVVLTPPSNVKVPFKINNGSAQYAIAQSATTTTINGTTNAINFTYSVPSNVNGAVALVAGALTLSNSATVKDTATNALTGNMSTLTGSVTVDTTKPTMTITAATVNGTNISSGSVTNDTSIVLTFTSTENTTDFISGDIDISDGSLDATFSGSEKVYTATLTTITDATYTIDVAANKFTDAAGNGNTAAQQFTWTRDTTAPVVTVNTGTDTVELGGTWTDAGATATDASGAVTVVTTGTVDTSTVGDYIITYTSTDGSGNIGTATRTVNVEDTTAPAPFNVGVVTAEGGTVKENYWNSTNENINVTVPIASDNTLVDGKVQLKVNIGNNNYNLGNEVTILQGYLGTNIVLQQTAAVLENIEGFVEGVNLTFTADITDVNNNGPTTGTNSANVLTVDQTAPTVISFTMSDGAGAVVTSLKIGDTPTVTLQFSEKAIFNSDNDITVEYGTLPTMTTTDEGKTWTGTFTPIENNESIGNELKLLSTWTDLAGNPGPTATINYNIDTKPPTIAIKVWDNSGTEVVDNVGTSATSFTIKFVPSETILNFDQRDDIEIEGTLSNPTSNYTFTTTSNYWYEYDSTLILTNGLSTGTIIIKIPAGKVTDQIGNSNEETTFTINYVP